jgi:putative thioredoxin
VQSDEEDQMNQVGQVKFTDSAGTTGGDLSKDTTTATFRQDVITESARQPVLVDFWAPWCGPCKQLTPILEKVVKQADGKVKLAKMNIDDHPQIPGQLGIQSIPAVIAFQKGQPVDGFMGALPEGQVKAFIERLVGPIGDDRQQLLADAEAAAAQGETEEAVGLYRDVLARDGGDVRAIGGLARILAGKGELDAARQLLERVPTDEANEPAVTAARAALDLAVQSASLGDVAALEKAVAANPIDLQARFDLALALNGRGEKDAAVDQLLEIVKRDRKWNDDGARKQLVQFFEAWGPTDEATVSARRKLSALLFS